MPQPSSHQALEDRLFLRAPAITTRASACVPILWRLALALVALFIQDRFVPGLRVEAPFLAITAFGILVLARTWSPEGVPKLPPLSALRVASFIGFHLVLGAIAYWGSDLLSASRSDYSFTASLISLSKLLILLPTVILFPVEKKFVRRLAPELFAAMIVLFTYSPQRLFHLIWPKYSQVLGAAITHLAATFVHGTHLVKTTDSMIVVGPAFNMFLDITCGGIYGVTVFQLVFGMIIALEWNRIKGRRALFCYVVGISVSLLANVLRLVIVFVTGNLILRPVDLNAYSWVLFVVMFVIIIRPCYDWMVPVAR